MRAHQLSLDRTTEWAREVRTLVAGWQFFRGFVENVWLDAATFLAWAPELYRRAPVLQLYLSGLEWLDLGLNHVGAGVAA